MSDLANEVEKVIRERDQLENLCSEILTTIAIERNHPHTIGEMYKDCHSQWKQRLQDIVGDSDEA